MAKQQTPMADALMRAIIESGETFLGIERETGVKRHCISRFLRGSNSLQLDTADKLAAYFGIECRQRRRKRKAR